ncbi:uncharacterized protein LOC129268470 isoform X2 [Lytechinus pictus]|uniref:uncharacterized protein LOC129268470 isoform X2 n=1 Tax=Lytechinus pictus TaxID=7653 RepID=UPI0030B9E89E
MLKSGLCIHKQLYKKECDSYYSKLFEAKSSYFKGEIAGSDSKQLFQIVKKLSSPLQSTTFPDHDSDEDLANRFGEFFENKVASIISSFNVPFSDDLLLPSQTGISHDSNLSEFDLVSEMQVKRVIKSLPSKSCSLDPLPTWLVKACLDELLPVITLIMNLSLSSGVVPESFKTACVLPLLKKPSLETKDFKNNRPIANLPFLSKVLERIVAAQLRTHLDEKGLFPPNQSAYRHFHFTETALIKVQNDLLLAVDKGQETVLILLDYSAAFDTLDHGVLLQRLEHDYGFSGTVLLWLESYLARRSHKVVVLYSLHWLQGVTNRNILRLGIHSLASPLWEVNSIQQSTVSLCRFLHALRGILRVSLAVCVLTIPTHLYQDESKVRKIERLCDTVIRLESFAGSDKETNPVYKEYHEASSSPRPLRDCKSISRRFC